MKYIEVYRENIDRVIRQYIKEQFEGILLFRPENCCVFTSLKDSFNFEYCKQNNIDVYHLLNSGGVIVASPGDIEIAHFSRDLENRFSETIIDNLVKTFKDKGLNAIIDHNDILIDGYKVCGCASAIYEGIKYTVFQISINVNIDAIKNVCTKPMNKIPKGLNEYGITHQEIKDFILKTLGDIKC